MKKIMIIISLILAGYLKVAANNADLFTYDKAAVQNSLADLNVLETYVTQHPALAVIHESGNGSVFVNGIELTSTPMQRGGWGPVPYPFFWGCVLGPIGLVIVMGGTNGNQRATYFAAEGCVLFCIFWLWYFAWAPGYYR